MSIFKKLINKWNIKSNMQLFIILVVFSVNGSFAAYIGFPIMNLIGKYFTNPFIFWIIRILLVFIIYQITLPLIGFLFGQFRFFWDFEIKMLRRIGIIKKK